MKKETIMEALNKTNNKTGRAKLLKINRKI
jgi:hypothetical protein